MVKTPVQEKLPDTSVQSENQGRATSAGFKATNCRKISAAKPEDITIDQATGVAFISSLEGAIYGLDLQSDDLKLINLTRDLTTEINFKPHGISLYSDNDEKRLFVVNHRGKHYNTIEIFAIEPDRLRHVRSILDKEGMLTNPNDIVSLGPDQFYVTNISRFESPLMGLLERLLRLTTGSVVYYNGDEFTKIASDIAMANGIAVNHAHKRLYVAASQSKSLLVYAWDPNDPSRHVNRAEEIKLGTVPDNLEWDQAENLWLGTHPSLTALTLYLLRLAKKAPSQVLRLRLTGVAEPVVEEVYRNDGTELSASSVAALYHTTAGQQLLIGSLDDHFLICELKSL